MFFAVQKNRMAKAAGFAVCLILGFAASAHAQTEKQPSLAAATAGGEQRSTATDRYYIDFRVAQIGAYGHSYVAYGRLNTRGKPADAHYADLHPMGNYFIMAMGHVLPVPANTVWDPDVLKLPVASSYMRPLNAAQYARLQVALREAQAESSPTGMRLRTTAIISLVNWRRPSGCACRRIFSSRICSSRRCDG